METLVFDLAESGGVVLVEARSPGEGTGLERAGFAESVARKASMTFEEALATVRPTAEIVVNQFAGMMSPPAEVSLSFGLRLTAETTALIVSAGGESHLEVTLKWVPKA